MPNDPLLDRIKRINDLLKTRRHNSGAAQSASATGQVQQNLTMLHVFLWQVFRALLWLRAYVFMPLWRPVWQGIKWLWRKYRELWDRVVYVKDEYGVIRFSKVRGGLMILATAICIKLSDDVALLVFDLGLYTVTAQRHEQIYLLNSHDILPRENTFSVTGGHQLPFTDHNSLYFRVRPSLFNHAWSLLHTGLVFFPDYVAGAVPGVPSKCTITSYGVRWKFLMRGLDIYPDLLSVSCVPIGVASVRVGTG